MAEHIKTRTKEVPPDLSIRTKIDTRGHCTYEPAVMCDKTVYELAQHYYTIDKIAEFFSVSTDTVLTLHHEAFKAGKANARNAPRFIMRRYFEELSEKPQLTTIEPVEVGDGKVKLVPAVDLAAMARMIELHAKMYEGLGKVEPAATVEINQLSTLTTDELEDYLGKLGYVKRKD